MSDHALHGWANRYGLLQLQRNGWPIGYLGAGDLDSAIRSGRPGR